MLAMLTLVEEDVPEFLIQRDTIAYCSRLHVQKTKSSLVLGRNLRFYEFRKKAFVHHIDLRETSLQPLASELKSYSGPVSSFLIRDDVTDTSGAVTSYSMLHAAEELPLSIGKYVWLSEHIYLLLRCWQTLLVLERPTALGASFKLVAEYNNVLEYRLVRGPIKYQAYVELHFANGKRLRTNFQSDNTLETPPAGTSSCNVAGFKHLMQRVHFARAELQAQRAQTQLDFVQARELHAFGAPGQRSPLLEEKQLLRRCGDIWTRICGDTLVVGTLLTNTAGTNRTSTLHAIRPLLRLPDGCGLNYEHRMYELPLQPDGQPPEDFDDLAQFWAIQETTSNNLSWRPASCDNNLPPERSAVLLVRLQLEDLLPLDSLQLLALYELQDECPRQRQLQLASINVAELLQEQELHVPRFARNTLHQDFLAVIMTQSAHCALQLQFMGVEQQAQFEQLLSSKLGFTVATASQNGDQLRERESMQLLDDTCPPEDFAFGNQKGEVNSSASVHRIFYHGQRQQLLLHNDPGQHWHIYASSQTQLSLLLRRLLRDLLKLHCNLSLLKLDEEACCVPSNAAMLLESALRDELQAKAELCQLQPARSRLLASNLKRVHRLEMASDRLLTVIKSQMPKET